MPRIMAAHCVANDPATDHQNMIFVVPRGDNLLVLGGLVEPGEWEINVGLDYAPIRDLLQRNVEFLPVLAAAQLDHADPLRVGLRPFRGRSVRLEHEAGTRIIHNYGHGGAGVSLSWGCAEHVAQLASRLLDDPRCSTGAQSANPRQPATTFKSSRATSREKSQHRRGQLLRQSDVPPTPTGVQQYARRSKAFLLSPNSAHDYAMATTRCRLQRIRCPLQRRRPLLLRRRHRHDHMMAHRARRCHPGSHRRRPRSRQTGRLRPDVPPRRSQQGQAIHGARQDGRQLISCHTVWNEQAAGKKPNVLLDQVHHTLRHARARIIAMGGLIPDSVPGLRAYAKEGKLFAIVTGSAITRSDNPSRHHRQIPQTKS